MRGADFYVNRRGGFAARHRPIFPAQVRLPKVSVVDGVTAFLLAPQQEVRKRVDVRGIHVGVGCQVALGVELR